jgi:hypothetical protein
LRPELRFGRFGGNKAAEMDVLLFREEHWKGVDVGFVMMILSSWYSM